MENLVLFEWTARSGQRCRVLGNRMLQGFANGEWRDSCPLEGVKADGLYDCAVELYKLKQAYEMVLAQLEDHEEDIRVNRADAEIKALNAVE